MGNALLAIAVSRATQPFERLVRVGLGAEARVLVIDDGCAHAGGVAERAVRMGAEVLRHQAPRGHDATAALAVRAAARWGVRELVLVDGGEEPMRAAALLAHVRPLERGRPWAPVLLWRALDAGLRAWRERRGGLPAGTLGSRARRVVLP